MKSFILSSFFFLIFILSSSGQTIKKVLFIGNSYTSVNNLPSIISNLAVSTGDVLIYDSNTPGGARFMNHASNATTLNKINSNTWDYVVLQAQSQETSFSEFQMATEVYPFAISLSNAIRANNECSQPLFYMTWGKENGDASNCNFIPWVCTYTGMDDVIRATYISMSTENQAELSPVGAVWRYIRTNHPTIGLYSSDSSHPSLEGSYAAGCAFYTMIYKKDPTLIAWNSTLSASVANTIKMAAKTIVFDELTSWDFTVNTAVADFSEIILAGNVSFTNMSPAFDSLLWDFGDGNQSTEQNPTHIYIASGEYTVSLTTTKCGKSKTETKTIQIDTNLDNTPFESDKRISVYPNPSLNYFNISMGKKHNKINVLIFNVLGVLIDKKEFQNLSFLTIDVSTVARGTYFLKIIADEDFYTSKIVTK